MNVEKTVWIIAVCMIITMAVANVGQFITIRVVVKNQQAQLVQIQQQIIQRDRQIQQLVGQLKASKTLAEVKKVLETIQ